MKDPITFLEDSIKQLKSLVEKGLTSNNKYFDEAFVAQLEKDSKSALFWCLTIDRNAVLHETSHAKARKNVKTSELVKTQHVLLSDLITAYNKLTIKENERSKFVLAYYYDVLRNESFGDAKNCDTWNELVEQPSFAKHIEVIKRENLLSKEKASTYLLSAHVGNNTDNGLNHLETFIKNAFELNFKDAANRAEFFELNAKPKVSTNTKAPAQDDSLEKVMAELEELIGLDNVKQDVKNLVNLLEIQKKREASGLHNAEFSLHAVFLGPPGTGKTTIARLLARIYKHIGLLHVGQLYETDREGLVAGYMGQTATKVDTVVKESIGGVLFIDEAYALTQNNFGQDYGAEAVNTLLKRMEDHRKELAVVVAGYSEPMKEFIESNPGLRSRFSRYFFFDHFTPDQLLAIFEMFCKKSSFIITPDAKEKLADTFSLLYEKKDEGFGNARVVRNLFEKCIQNQANRLVGLKKLTKTLLRTFEEVDIPDPKETVRQVFVTVGG